MSRSEHSVPRRCGELWTRVARTTQPAAVIREEGDFLAPAVGARDLAIRPPERHHEAEAHVRVSEVANGVNEGGRGGRCLVHAPRIASQGALVKYVVTLPMPPPATLGGYPRDRVMRAVEGE